MNDDFLKVTKNCAAAREVMSSVKPPSIETKSYVSLENPAKPA